MLKSKGFLKLTGFRYFRILSEKTNRSLSLDSLDKVN